MRLEGEHRPHPEGPSLCCGEFGLHPVGNVELLKGFKQGGSGIRFVTLTVLWLED